MNWDALKKSEIILRNQLVGAKSLGASAFQNHLARKWLN